MASKVMRVLRPSLLHSPFFRSFRRSFSPRSFQEVFEEAAKKDYVYPYDVEITPPLPPKAPEPYNVHKGHYNGWWLRIHGESFSEQDLKDAITTLETKATSAVYVAFAEHVFSGPKFYPILHSLGYQFHHYIKNEFVYYRWVDPKRHDMVPTYATSIEGGSAIVLSPDMERVFLVKELARPFWGLPGGAVNLAEGAYAAMERELREEASVQLDPNFAPLLVCVSNQPSARDNMVNDHYNVFVVRALNENFAIDPHELAGGRWFDKNRLLELGKDVVRGERSQVETPDGETFTTLVLHGLRNFHNGKYLERTQSPYNSYLVQRDWYW